MEITRCDEKVLEMNSKPLFERLLPTAIGAAGILLTLSTLKSYGPQSWYRTGAWLGLTIGIVGILFLALRPPVAEVFVHRDQNLFRIRTKRGWLPFRESRYRTEEINEIRIDKQAQKDLYRLSVSIAGGGWVPLSAHYERDLYQLQQSGQTLRSFLGITEKSGE